ncbi:cytoskeleton-associated protein 2 isoform X2 [Hypomesus transpacificus]|uniref:cytoskeleton-associated protein 2 isoform X2 n=1 Tax=Hypomesus transpacificus TaxID=137520 RepID=UPI001F0806F8|nr:cytoskeleton-associated protein 2 isoform X2 [Hypomesus transpacificus]
METISKAKVNLKKRNKENTRPASGLTKTLNKREVSKTVTTSSAPLHSKLDEKEIILGQEADVVKKVKTGQGAASDAKSRHTLSQAFLTKQAVRQRKIVTEAPKLQASIPLKPAPGTYKGRVVQSKIGAIWKSSCSLDGGAENKASTKPSVPKVETQKTRNLTKSFSDLHGRGTQKPPQGQPSKSKSVTDGPNLVPKRPAASGPAASRDAGPPARHAPCGYPPRASSTKPAMASKGTESRSTKPKMPVQNPKVNKPAVSSTLSQYRVHTDTAEERKVKLAEWLASKGKTLKRPPMTSRAAPITRLVEVIEVQAPSQIIPEPKSSGEPQPPAQTETKPQPGLQAPDPNIAPPPDNNQGPELLTACSSSPLIMNTTLDLLDNSDMDLPVDPEVVVNLCSVLEAMEAPSQCVDEPEETQDEFVEENVVHDEPNNKENELPETVLDVVKSEDDVKSVAEERASKKINESCSEEGESDCEDLTGTTPETQGASLVKYSVRTTPYLQSVKKTMEGEASATGSSRKNTIKDLKFLTPVRRSCRIQRKSSRLPGMLTDHDPCVSSLAELVQLDDDANAYIYRKNPALLEELPDHAKDLGKI